MLDVWPNASLSQLIINKVFNIEWIFIKMIITLKVA